MSFCSLSLSRFFVSAHHDGAGGRLAIFRGGVL